MRITPTVLTLLAAAAALAGCATTFDRAVERGEQASAKGDLIEAAQAFREACRMDPDEAGVCRRADEAAQRAVDQEVAAARPVCDRGDVFACLDALEPARHLLPADAGVAALIDAAAARYAEACGQAQALPEIVQVLACLERVERRVNQPSYSARIDEEARNAAALLQERASDAAGSPGAALALSSAASCLGGGVEDAAAGSRFHAEATLPVRIQVAVGGASVSTEELCAALPAAARCAGEAPSALEAEVRAQLGPVRHRVRVEERTVRYAAGVSEVPNPDFVAATHARDAAQEAVNRLEPRAEVAQSHCDQLKWDTIGADLDSPASRRRERVCDKASTLQTLLSDRESDLRGAELEMGRTPSTLSHTIYAEYSYAIEHHVWQAHVEASVRGHPWGQSLTYEDAANTGYDPAGVVVDPLQPPAPSYFRDVLARRLGAELAAQVQGILQGRANDRARACGGPVRWEDEWLQCWAEVNFWRGSEPDGALLLRAVGGDEAPRCRSDG